MLQFYIAIQRQLLQLDSCQATWATGRPHSRFVCHNVQSLFITFIPDTVCNKYPVGRPYFIYSMDTC